MDNSIKNLYILFGCAPEEGVKINSTIVDNYINCLEVYLENNNRVL